MRFIYVMSETDKDKLEQLGYNLLKTDKANSVFIFENKAELNFNIDDIQYVLSNVLTF